MNKSKNTTVLGILQFIAVLVSQATFVFDGDSATDVAWGVLVPSLLIMIAGFKQKDSGVSGTE